MEGVNVASVEDGAEKAPKPPRSPAVTALTDPQLLALLTQPSPEEDG